MTNIVNTKKEWIQRYRGDLPGGDAAWKRSGLRREDAARPIDSSFLGRGQMNSGASTSVIVASSLISTCSDGPAVSLNGSPTVSPTTAALCGSDFLPTTTPSTLNSPLSMYFLALSHAPPALFRNVASRMPA